MPAARRAKTPPVRSSRDPSAPPQEAAYAGRAREEVRQLYNGSSRRAVSFRYGLLAFDLITITFVVVSSFFLGSPVVAALDVVFGLAILVEFSMRLFISRSRLGELLHPLGLADLIVIVSFLVPAAGGSFGFLRAVRALRLFRSYRLVARLQRDFSFFKRNQDAVFSVVNLLVFILIMTALVHASQSGRNAEITNYADALYFTVTTLTTTGFGDITMDNTTGRLLAVLIMIFGVSLFIRLAQTLFRPTKVHCECEECGLTRHDADAVHCKHCGTVIHIETEGQD
jgi:voltage-gated potassium channel